MELKKIFILITLLIPLKTFAGSVEVGLNCPASASPNSEVSCTVEAQGVGSELSGIQFNYSLSNITFKSFTVSSDWTTYANNANGVSLGRTETTSKVGVGIIKLTMGSTDATVSLTKIQGTNNNYETLNGSNVSKTIKVASSNANLKSLGVEGATLNPTFNKDVTSYQLTLDKDSVKITGEAEDSSSSVKGTGYFNLKYGDNTFKIEVTSATGSKKTYTITIKRPDGRGNNNYLKSLSLDYGNIEFDKNVTSYDLIIEKEVKSVKINATVEDNKASFVNKYGPRTVNLNYGNNKVEIKVKAENEDVRIYTLNITREDGRSSEASLKKITLSKGNITFDPSIDTYDVTVKNEIEKIEIKADPKDSKATVKIDNKDLVVGLNVIKITVTAENGTEKVYTLNVTRLEPGEGFSDNTNLKKLTIENHDIKFDNDVTLYDVKIEDEDKLKFNITPEEESTTYEIKGNEKLENGSKVRVIVKSESGITKEYIFNIIKDSNEVYGYGIAFYIIMFILGSIFGILIALIISKKKKKTLNSFE